MKFECQSSCKGGCCKIPKGSQLFIFLTPTDRMRLAAFLKKPINKFAKQSHFTFTRFSGPGTYWHLKTDKDKCKFLSKEGKCSVYEARPTQCATWPLWPENTEVETQEQFMKTCPGIGVGPELSSDEINSKLDEQRKADGLYANKKSGTSPFKG